MSDHSRLQELPVSFFAMVMGLAGLTIAWEKTNHVLNLGLPINLGLAALTFTVFLVLTGIYGLKIIRYPDAVKAELKHPIKLSFFPAISISLILLSVCTHNIHELLSQGLWVVGSALHFILLLFVLNSWVNHSHFKIQHMNPAWFIPAVGNVLVPIVGVSLGYIEISWFFFSIGMLFWLVLLTIVMNRILFHDPLPAKLEPTLFIMIAPPAIGFISYVKLTGGVDEFARILFYLALFFTLFLLTQIPRLLKLPFALSWWAYSFPMAAITIASWVMFEHTQIRLMNIFALAFLSMLTAIVVFLLFRTGKAIMNKKICLPE